MTDCTTELVALALLSLALLVSLCLNVFFCIRQRAKLCRDTEECCYPHIYEGERPSQDEGHYFPNVNHLEQQENPIYGNISTERRGSEEVCYEMMTMQHTRDRMKTVEADLNYASLDLKLAKKHKKRHRHQHQGGNSLQDLLPIPHVNAFLEVEADTDAHLPSRDTSTMVSHSSIYLNSQQIAQEADEMEREREINVEREDVDWEGKRSEEDWRNKVWRDEQESEKRNDFSNGSVCTQLAEVEEIVTDHFISSFSHDSIQQD